MLKHIKEKKDINVTSVLTLLGKLKNWKITVKKCTIYFSWNKWLFLWIVNSFTLLNFLEHKIHLISLFSMWDFICLASSHFVSNCLLRHKCDICFNSFGKIEELEDHSEKMHNIFSKKCTKCDKIFLSAYNFSHNALSCVDLKCPLI
jgi:hypothetical protein